MAMYKVVDISDLEQYGIRLGDKCLSRPHIGYDVDGCWFYNKEWADNGIWYLGWEQVRKVGD